MCAQCDFSKHSGIFCFGNTHPLIVPCIYCGVNEGAQKKKREGGRGEKEREGWNEGRREESGRERQMDVQNTSLRHSLGMSSRKSCMVEVLG